MFLIQLIVDFRLMLYFLAFSLKSCKSKIGMYKTLALSGVLKVCHCKGDTQVECRLEQGT